MPASYPHLTDEYDPTNPDLWERVLEVARGDLDELTIGGRTIHKPEDGFVWPSPPASAWAVKQYNGFGGAWRRESSWHPFQKTAMTVLRTGGVVTSRTDQEHHLMHQLAQRGFARRTTSTLRGWMWEASVQVRTAGLTEELQRKIRSLLTGPYDWLQARKVGEWFEDNFRINSPKTPRGGKKLKEKAQHLTWVLKHRVLTGTPMDKTPEQFFEETLGTDPSRAQEVLSSAQKEVRELWSEIEPHLDFLVSKFTDEGGTVVPPELKVGSRTYKNEAGLTEAKLKKYAGRLEAILRGLKGWRSKALKGGLTVVLASPRDFRGTAGGKYRREEDALYIRTTPAVLKRSAGYASFEYIIVHELGHRYERYHRLPTDFDRPKWWTTKYSRTESAGGSEAFAELFALGHFRLTGSWDPSTIDRFEYLMTSGNEE